MRLNEISKEQKIYEAICNDKPLALLFNRLEKKYSRVPLTWVLKDDGFNYPQKIETPEILKIKKIIEDRILEIKNLFH